MNIKFILEGMEEAGSVALEELVQREKDRFFSSVDYIVISDNLWVSQRKPALTYGTRGNSYFMVEVLASSTCGVKTGAVDRIEELLRKLSLGAHSLGGHRSLGAWEYSSQTPEISE